MTVSNTGQLIALLCGMIAGAGCGAAAGVINALRSELRLGKFLGGAADLLLWIFAGVSMVWINLRFGDGSVRVYQIIAAVCGMVLYMLCFGRLTERAAGLVLRGIKLLFSPLAFLMRGIKLYLGAIAQKIRDKRDFIKRTFDRKASAGKVRKKLRKKYKKML